MDLPSIHASQPLTLHITDRLFQRVKSVQIPPSLNPIHFVSEAKENTHFVKVLMEGCDMGNTVLVCVCACVCVCVYYVAAALLVMGVFENALTKPIADPVCPDRLGHKH